MRFGASVWRKKPKKEAKSLSFTTFISWPGRLHVTGTAKATLEDSFWGEMNRREKWDRDYENRLKLGPPPPSVDEFLGREERHERDQKWSVDMGTEKDVEDTMRREWDNRNRGIAKGGRTD